LKLYTQNIRVCAHPTVKISEKHQSSVDKSFKLLLKKSDQFAWDLENFKNTSFLLFKEGS
jgi:hypothetical protein